MQSRILTKIFRWSEETRTRSNHHFTFSTWRNNRQIGIKRTRRRANVENREITRGEAAELFNRTVNLIDEMERRWRERLWREAAHSDSTFKSHNYEFPANYAPRYKVRSPFRLFGKQSAKIGVYADRSIRCLPITYVGRWLGRSESAFSSTPWNTKRGERERERELSFSRVGEHFREKAPVCCFSPMPSTHQGEATPPRRVGDFLCIAAFANEMQPLGSGWEVGFVFTETIDKSVIRRH